MDDVEKLEKARKLVVARRSMLRERKRELKRCEANLQRAQEAHRLVYFQLNAAQEKLERAAMLLTRPLRENE